MAKIASSTLIGCFIVDIFFYLRNVRKLAKPSAIRLIVSKAPVPTVLYYLALTKYCYNSLAATLLSAFIS